jgi:hypothetical protein
MQALRQAVEGKARPMEIARRVYAVSDICLDPFSPGLAPFIRLAAADLPALRTRTIERLGALERADPTWQRFYAGRRAAFQALELTAGPDAGGATGAARDTDPRTAAAQALRSGDMRALAKLAETMMAPVEPRTGGAVPERPAAGPITSETPRDLSRVACP